MRKSFTLVTMLLFVAVSVIAQTVPVNVAMQKALSLCPQSATMSKGQHSAQLDLAYTEADAVNTYFYVFNYPSGGYAIIGGDETAREILGFSEQGEFDINNIPCGLQDMLGCYRQQIAAGIEAVKSGNVAMRAKKAARAPKNDIAPLIKTKWNQDAPFNCAIPSLGEGYYPFVTGCNATAAAQIMKYYSYAVGSGSNNYQQRWNTSDGLITLTYEADFANDGIYDFGNMLNVYATYTDEQAQAVGKLMYHVGVAFNMNYGPAKTGGSSSVTTSVYSKLPTHFGYDANSIKYEYKSEYSDDAWDDMMYNELAERRPIMYSGRTVSNSGHGFLLVGYRASDNTFAVNWGWGGYCDGYYALNGSDALDSTGNGQYNQSQSATIGIQPGTAKIDVAFGIGSSTIVEGRTTSVNHPEYYQGNITYSSSNTSVATIDAYGNIKAIAPGTTTITVNGTAADCYKATNRTFTLTVTTKPADYNASLVVTEGEGTTDYVKVPTIKNNGNETINITNIVIYDKDDEDNVYIPSIGSLNELEPRYRMWWTLDLNNPIAHPRYEIVYTYRGNQCFIEYDPDPSYDPIATGISAAEITNDGVAAIYDAAGRSITELRSGINIVRMANGTVVKVMKK